MKASADFMEKSGSRSWAHDKQKVEDFVISSYYLKVFNLSISAKKEKEIFEKFCN